MSINTTPVNSFVNKGLSKYSDAVEKNPSNNKNGKDYIKSDVKKWIITPILLFHSAGFIVLTCLAWVFAGVSQDLSNFVWIALIGAIAGTPYAFSTNVKKLKDAVSGTT